MATLRVLERPQRAHELWRRRDPLSRAAAADGVVPDGRLQELDAPVRGEAEARREDVEVHCAVVAASRDDLALPKPCA